MQHGAVLPGGCDHDARPGGREPELVERAGRGDQDAWNEIVRRYGGLVWSVARAHRLDPDEAADVSQVTWLRLVEHVGSVRQPERLGAWLATTARRESLRVLKLRRREVPVADEHDLERRQPQAPASDVAVLLAERDAGLWRAFGSLPERCQPLLRLLTADPPLSYAEIAEVLAIPIGSIGPTRARCLDCLRRRLSGHGVG